MVKKILQMNVKYHIPVEELVKYFEPIAKDEEYVSMEGLEWKIWLHNPANKTMGGIYLFKDEKFVNDYLNGKYVTGMKNYSGFSDMDCKVWDISAFTKMTRGPV